jgi:hypothetical protein
MQRFDERFTQLLFSALTFEVLFFLEGIIPKDTNIQAGNPLQVYKYSQSSWKWTTGKDSSRTLIMPPENAL